MGEERQSAFRGNEEQTIPLPQQHPGWETKKQSHSVTAVLQEAPELGSTTAGKLWKAN